MRNAEYTTQEGNNFRCALCPHHCLIRPGKTGSCRTRINKDGKLYTANYGASTAAAIDPIEKKPLYHFYPGADILSIGSWGCNFTCRFCQNWHIAQTTCDSRELSPAQAVQLAASVGGKNIGIAYTYSEPGVWFEFVRDTAAAARHNGMKNVIVTNGFINPRPLAELLSYTDAMNIDVKAFTENFYRTICSGSLQHVKQTVEQAINSCHVEVTTLLIPGLNDSEPEIRTLAKWLSGLSPDIVLHLSRYFPNYQLDLPPTPMENLFKARQTAREYLRYVYIGNAGDLGINTQCPTCGKVVIDRAAQESHLTVDKLCPSCSEPIPIVGRIMY